MVGINGRDVSVWQSCTAPAAADVFNNGLHCGGVCKDHAWIARLLGWEVRQKPKT
jgi:transglutaminase-like putative cysteine protease